MTTTPEQPCPHTHAPCDPHRNAWCSVCPLRSPSPEQLQAWREEFEMQLLPATEMTLDVMGKYWLNGLEVQWQGYLRAKQETEQIMKLAKFGAMVAISYVNGERFVPVHELDNLAMDYGVVDSAFVFTSDTKTTIKELLK